MNFRVVSRMLGIVSLLIGAMMLFSLPWAHPALGYHTDPGFEDAPLGNTRFETHEALALIASSCICVLVGASFLWLGRGNHGKLFRKEAIAVVGLSWLLSTLLGALPFYLSGTIRGPSVRLTGPEEPVFLSRFNWNVWRSWYKSDPLSEPAYRVVSTLLANDVRARGVTRDELVYRSGVSDPDAVFDELKSQDPYWEQILIAPGEEESPTDRVDRYRIRWVRMGIIDSLFESQSGFSTTGATVMADLEDPQLVAHCILFYRSSTHFLGGLGIIVLFVTLLGPGTTGKVLMQAEMPGPSKEGSTARMQSTAWRFTGIYVALTFVLSVLLCFYGMNVFDSICHAFGTLATGGFSTYNSSVGHFDSPIIDYTITIFMVLSGTNFILLYFTLIGSPRKLLQDTEWRVYAAIIFFVTLAVLIVGYRNGSPGFENLWSGLRFASFQVVAILTTTGYGTTDFDQWPHVSRGMLLLLMFVGGCAGSTGGGMKVIRHILAFKILRLEIEKSFHPRVVRLLRLGGETLDDQALRHNILVYFALIAVIFSTSWLVVLACEPTDNWGPDSSAKLVDSASAVAATLNNIGPGLGIVGPVNNYGHFSGLSKLLFVALMMIGRLEVYAVLALLFPRFWRPP